MNILRWAGHRSTNLFVRPRRGNTRPAIVNDRRQKAAENPDEISTTVRLLNTRSGYSPGLSLVILADQRASSFGTTVCVRCVLDFVLNYAACGEVFHFDAHGQGNVTYFYFDGKSHIK